MLSLILGPLTQILAQLINSRFRQRKTLQIEGREMWNLFVLRGFSKDVLDLFQNSSVFTDF